MIRDRPCKAAAEETPPTTKKGSLHHEQHQFISASLTDVASFPLLLKAITLVSGGDSSAGDRLELHQTSSAPQLGRWAVLWVGISVQTPPWEGSPSGRAGQPQGMRERCTDNLPVLAQILQREELTELRLLSLSKGQRR